MTKRTRWYAPDLRIADEPLVLSLIKYRIHKDRWQPHNEKFNLVSSRVVGSRKHMPIIDLDFDHSYVVSSTPGHGHLYLNEPISWWRWTALLVGLRLAGAIETGFMVWSLRRGGNFVRTTVKTDAEQPKNTYGWFRKLKKDPVNSS